MSHYSFLDEFFLFFFILNFVKGWGLQGQRTDMQGWKMNRIEMDDVKETKNKQKES